MAQGVRLAFSLYSLERKDNDNVQAHSKLKMAFNRRQMRKQAARRAKGKSRAQASSRLAKALPFSEGT